ncbi:MAG: UDP-N-acetylglucosamine 2-epimerase (non-hydrolyzing) [Patescibacteria group bacterium]|nr:UDP-N-acetylglucosamine 2-epimerase (non-hydrolyzing) [Patescibacteria group bacterium]
MIAVVIGTRPEIIKTAPLVKEAQRRGEAVVIIHTGQHYDEKLDALFFEELKLPSPAINLHVGSHPPAQQIAAMIQGLSDAFQKLQPTVVIVQGDTNTVLAGALTAHKMGIKLAHLEAGLRSDDWGMPEEANRVVADALSDILFCPTEVQTARLAQEGIGQGVHVVGNPIVDAVQMFRQEAANNPSIENNYGQYVLLTMHRPSNVDEKERLEAMMETLDVLGSKLNLKIIFPVHPRTSAKLKETGLDCRYANSPNLSLIPPIGYLPMLNLMDKASIILTDSGGIQEEANILQVPCVTLRANTERPETLDVGGNALYNGTDPEALHQIVKEMMAKPRDWICPFGDGRTSERCLDILKTNGLL